MSVEKLVWLAISFDNSSYNPPHTQILKIQIQSCIISCPMKQCLFIYMSTMIKYTASSTIYKILLVSGQKVTQETEKKIWYFALVAPIFPHSHLKTKMVQYALCAKYLFTIKYFLLNCDSFWRTHWKYYQVCNLKEFFKNTKPEDIFSFLKENWRKKFFFYQNWPNQPFH